MLGAHHEDLFRVTVVVAVDGITQSLVCVRELSLRSQQIEDTLREVAAWTIVRQLRQSAAGGRRDFWSGGVPTEAETVDVARPVSLPRHAWPAIRIGNILGVVLVANAFLVGVFTPA